MVERQAISRLNREFVLLQQANCTQFVASPSENDTLVWHYCIFNLPKDTPYHGGQYHGKLVFPREYPLRPPSIMMLTPSGRFEVNKRLCLSMSDFHPETWNPSWRVETILLGLVSFMCDESDPATAGGIRAPASARRNDALLSFFRNRRNREFCSLFPHLSMADSYYIGLGYHQKGTIDTSAYTLASVPLNEKEIDSICSLDDILNLTKAKGVEPPTTNHNAVDKQDKAMFNAASWILILAISSLWVYSQAK